jgi:hypothetical protein
MQYVLGVYFVGAGLVLLHYRKRPWKFALKAAFIWPEIFWLLGKIVYQAVKYKVWQ